MEQSPQKSSTEQEFIGFIHNVSPVYNNKYFECQIRFNDGNDVVLEDFPDIAFERSQIASTITLAAIKSLRPGQHATVQNNGTYIFTDVMVRKDQYTGEIFLNTAKQGTSIEETEPFNEVLAISVTTDAEVFLATAVGEVLGVVSVKSYMYCCKCGKKFNQLLPDHL
eukprot:gene13338-14717_t